jgi:hypothetical protein
VSRCSVTPTTLPIHRCLFIFCCRARDGGHVRCLVRGFPRLAVSKSGTTCSNMQGGATIHQSTQPHCNPVTTGKTPTNLGVGSGRRRMEDGRLEGSLRTFHASSFHDPIPPSIYPYCLVGALLLWRWTPPIPKNYTT